MKIITYNPLKKTTSGALYRALLPAALFAIFSHFSNAQTSNCGTTIAPGATAWPAYSAGQVVCLTTGSFPENGTPPDEIRIPSGATVSAQNQMQNGSGWKITVYGTLNYTGQNLPQQSTITVKKGGTFKQSGSVLSANGNSRTNFVVESGGTAFFGATTFGNNIKLTNAGSIEFVSNGKIEFNGVFNNSGTIQTTSGNRSAHFDLKSGGNTVSGDASTFSSYNSGTVSVAHFENNTPDGFNFTNSGNITVQGKFYTHGKLTNSGSITTTCGISDSPASMPNVPNNIAFFIGDKNADGLINSGTFQTCGNAYIGGKLNLSNGKLVVGGNLTLIKPIVGNKGHIQVDGEAKAVTDGSYTGTGMTFYDTSNPGTGITGYPSNGVNYTILPGSSTPLPVKLQSFELSESEKNVLVSWTTSEEANSASFEIQRSTDAKGWTAVSKIDASGNSSTEKKYGFTDLNALTTTLYYRLKITDLDGKSEYGPLKSITPAAVAANAFLYPNPTKGNVKINDSNWYKAQQVFVYDALGKVVLKAEASALTDQQLNTQSLTTGIYHVRIVYNDGQKVTYSFKMVK